jgi:protease-4
VAGDGEILPAGADPGFDAGMTAAAMRRTLREVADDPSIRGVILRVDSPGGDAIASAEILHEVQMLSAKKPVLISMSDYAASGGYMMSMSGDPVLAYSNTLTGSIGVFFGKLTLRGLYDKIGLNKYLLTRGRWAAIDSDYTPLGPAERERLRQELMLYYRSFVERVAAGRKQSYETIEPLAQGRVWLGAQAKQNGLVDEIGGLDRAIELIKDKARIPPSERVSLVAYPARRTFLEVLMSRPETAAGFESAVDKLLGGLPWRSLAAGSGIVGLMPYGVRVR